MLRVTKLTDYATVLLNVLADDPDGVCSAAELAERSRLEPPTVSKVLKPLAHAGLVESFRGSAGGYRLVGIDGETTVVQRRCRTGHDMDYYIAGVIGSKTPRQCRRCSEGPSIGRRRQRYGENLP